MAGRAGFEPARLLAYTSSNRARSAGLCDLSTSGRKTAPVWQATVKNYTVVTPRYFGNRVHHCTGSSWVTTFVLAGRSTVKA